MADEHKYHVPVNLNRLELRNFRLQNLASAPTPAVGLAYFDTVLDTAGHFDSTSAFVPWDARKATNIPNAALTNSSLTLGSTSMALGSTTTTITGLASVTSTAFVGALTGNASTATTLATGRTIGLTGGATATGVSFNGSANINLNVTALDATTLTGTLAAARFPAFTGDVTTVAGAVATTIAPSAVTLAKMANLAANSLIGNATGVSATPTAVGLASGLTFSGGNLSIATGGVSNAMLTNSSLTIGSTNVALGATVTTFTGLASVTSTAFVGALTGNASTATTLATGRTIALTGVITATGVSFNGSTNISLSTAIADGALSIAKTSGLQTALNGKQATIGYTPANKAGDTFTGYVTLHADPVSAMHAATMQWVEAQIQAAAAGIDPKEAVVAATTANITLSGPQTIDTVSVVAGNRVLVKNQSSASQNGIYVVAAGAWTRATDAVAGFLTSGAMVLVIGGSQAGQQWYLQTPDPITVGTTAQTWVLFNVGQSYTNGNGLNLTSNSFSVKADTGIVVTGDGVGIDTAIVARKYSETIGNAVDTTFTITHNLGTQDVVVVVRNLSSNNVEYPGITNSGTNTVSVNFGATVIGTNTYRVTVLG